MSLFIVKLTQALVSLGNEEEFGRQSDSKSLLKVFMERLEEFFGLLILI